MGKQSENTLIAECKQIILLLRNDHENVTIISLPHFQGNTGVV
jgi:hypothetical protein